MPKPLFEDLESRRLFAGVTLITHGWNGQITDFVAVTAKAIAGRVGGLSQVSEYVLTIAPNSGGQLVAQAKHVDGTGTPQTTNSGEIILVVDWTSISTNPDYNLSYTASVIADFMMNATVDGVRLAELPLHSISQSRGTDLIDEITKSLGQSGVWVDQETYLDPKPVYVMGDAPSTVYDNLAFMDNYWRDDSNPNDNNSEGYPVDGAYNLNAPLPLQLAHDGSPSAHEAPAAYYIGTIDYNAHDSGQVPIYDSWYGDTPEEPARDQTGFLYTSIVGGTRPLSGVWAASGGTGARTPTGQSGEQWANVTDVAADGDTFAADQIFQINYIQQDRDGNSHVSFYLDSDRNPYNNNSSGSIGGSNFTPSSTISSAQTAAVANGVAPGTYWVAAKITDGQGHVRYSYSEQSVNITPASGQAPPVIDPPPVADPPPVVDPPPVDPPPVDPPPVDPPVDPPPVTTPPPAAVLGTDHTLRVTGTSGDDLIKLYQSPSIANRLMVSVNGTIFKFVLSSVQRVLVYGLDGNDSIVMNEHYGGIFVPTRLMGGTGNDTLIGASGNDSLTGDDGNDMIYGEVGNDTLYGGSGFDSIDGGNGTDRIYGGDDGDSILGGSQNDVIYGENGNDSIDGGNGNDHIDSGDGTDSVMGGAGNDTVNGQDNTADFINGGLGVDSVHGDLIDHLTAIEKLV